MSSTIKDIFQRVSCMLRRAERAGYAVNLGFERVTVKQESSCAVYLTLEELDRLNNLTGLSREAKAVRDRFLVGCFTALRISDYRSLTVDNFVNNTIQLKTQKTGEFVVIPVHPVIYEILKRNEDKLPKMPSQQAFGATIKRVCRKAGIDDIVIWERTVGHKVVRKRLKKWQLVSSHTARRTGATNMYLSGIPTARVMLLTGHKTEEAFFKYIRINKMENAKTLLEHEFFKRKEK